MGKAFMWEEKRQKRKAKEQHRFMAELPVVVLLTQSSSDYAAATVKCLMKHEFERICKEAQAV